MTHKIIKPLIVGLVVIFLGSFVVTFFDLYDTFPYIDKVFHFAGGFVVAWFFSQMWFEKLGNFNKSERLLILVSVTTMIGFLWELAEYSTSLPPLVNNILLRHYFYGGSLIDTLGDFVADISGAVVFYFLRK